MHKEDKRFMNIQLFAESYDDEQDELDIEDSDFEDIEETDETDESEIEVDLEEYVEDDTEEETEEGIEKNIENDEETAVQTDIQKEYEELKRKYARLEAQSKETLSKLGINTDGPIEEMLEQTAAEAEGISLSEYRQNKQETAELESAKALIKSKKLEELFSADLTELKKSFPDLLDVKDITKISNFEAFGKLRDAGVPAKVAYLAVNGDSVREKQESSARQKATSESKKHIQSVVSRKANSTTVTMSKKTLEEWRDMFPGKSDKEIANLYRQTL